MSTKISIIIPSFNQGHFLTDTIQSILDQNYDNVEIIVMDGGSTDNSVAVIKSFQDKIVYWQSKKDNGQSDAINRGFKIATGEFVTWLNSDDILLHGALKAVDDMIQRNPNCDFFLGNLLWMNRDGLIIRVGKSESPNGFTNRKLLFSNGGPSAFMRRSTLEQVGWLREDFHYMMDTELWHRLIATGHHFKRIPKYIWALRLHEDAKMSGHNFAGSELANKNHPSWIQKQKETDFIAANYPTSALLYKIWRISKLLRPSFYTRFTHKKLLNKHFKQLIQLQ